MRQYRRKVSYLSVKKLFAVVLLFVTIVCLRFVISGEYDQLCIIFSGFGAALLFLDLFAILGASGRYRYGKKSIEVSFGAFLQKRILYGNIQAAVISNGSYNSGRSDQMCYDMPMQYTVKVNGKKTKVLFPFVSLIGQRYPLYQIKSGMSIRDLAVINTEDIYCLGICWPGSLDELMMHTDMPVYILEDVYLRFKGLFDATFAPYAKENGHIFIVTDQIIPYEKYLGN